MLLMHLVAMLPRTSPRTLMLAFLLLCATTLALLLLGADPAFAVSDGSDPYGRPPGPDYPDTPGFPDYGDDGASDAGKNIGDLIRGIAGPVALSVAGLFGIGAIVRRDLAGALTLLVVSVVILLFVIPEGNEALHKLARVLADALGSA